MIRAFFWAFQILLHSAFSSDLPTFNIISTSDDEEAYSVTSPVLIRQTSDKMIFNMSSFSQSPSDGTFSPASPSLCEFVTIEKSDGIRVRDGTSPNTSNLVEFLAETLSDLNVGRELNSDSEYEMLYKSPTHPYVIAPQDLQVLDTPGRNERALYQKKAVLHQKQVRLESRLSPVSPQSPEEDLTELMASQHHRVHRSMSDVSDVIHHHVNHPSNPLPVGTSRYPSNVSSMLYLKDHHPK